MREAGNLTTSPIRSSLLSPSQNCSKRLVLGGACDYLLGPPRPKTLKPGGPFGAAVLANARKSCPPVCNVGTLIVRVGFFFGGGFKTLELYNCNKEPSNPTRIIKAPTLWRQACCAYVFMAGLWASDAIACYVRACGPDHANANNSIPAHSCSQHSLLSA